jgi:tRNA threonylcarbamoyladenosine biosynthesis protein TsaE
VVLVSNRSNLYLSDLEGDRLQFEVTAENEAETTWVATVLSPLLQAGDIVLLDGVLASGKTFFVRKLVETLGTEDEISSPTYAIANIYKCPSVDVLHVDAYRLENEKDFYNLGLELEVEGSICMIEWGSRIQEAFDDFLKISIKLNAKSIDERVFVMTAHGSRATVLLQSLKIRCQSV